MNTPRYLLSSALVIVLGSLSIESAVAQVCDETVKVLHPLAQSEWKCPSCNMCCDPIKMNCCQESKTTKTNTCYDTKVEEVCHCPPSATGCISGCIERVLPSVWNAWGIFTGGYVREKRTLEKTVHSTESKSTSCTVRYQCPHCHCKFVPSSNDLSK